MGISQSVKVNYLDASALAKILLLDCPSEKPGQEKLLIYFEKEPKPFYTTATCFAEAIGILKRKVSSIRTEDKISQIEYREELERLMKMVYGERISIIDVNFKKVPKVFDEAKKIAETSTKLSFCDTMQIVTLKEGMFSHFCCGSQPILITADKDLAGAAKKEKCKTWDIINEDAPN